LLVDHFRPLGDLHHQLVNRRENVPAARARSMKDVALELDGKLDDPLWRELVPYRLRELQTGRAATVPTAFKVAWMADALIFGVECEEIDAKPNVQATKNGDRKIWLGDCIEILLETQSHSYYQLVISPAGALVDLDRNNGLNFNWSSQAQVATHQGEDHWTAEVRIPVVIGDMTDDPNHDVVGRRPTEEFPWFFNICRQRLRGTDEEYSAFSPTGTKSFHETLKFGKLYVR
jgi:hypothetical protein